MPNIQGKADFSVIADQLQSAVETILNTTPKLLQAGRRDQVSRLEEIVAKLQREVERLRNEPGGASNND